MKAINDQLNFEVATPSNAELGRRFQQEAPPLIPPKLRLTKAKIDQAKRKSKRKAASKARALSRA